MINVFIDTSIFIAECFVKGKSISTLFEAAFDEKIHILLPDITECEVRRHLREDVEKRSGVSVPEKLKKSYMYAALELRPLIDKLLAVDVEKLFPMVEKELDKQFSRANVERLVVQKDFDITGIIEKYKTYQLPFSEKKNKEFPDAIVLQQLEQWCKEHNDKCVLLSSDSDMKAYKSEWLEYKELSDFISSLEDYEKLITPEKLMSVFQSSREAIEKKVKDWTYEQYDDDTLYINRLLIEDVHYSSINKVEVQLDDALKWEAKGIGCLFYKTYANIVVSIEVSHPDYDTGFYDSEDQQWYFIDDRVVDYFEGRIRVPVSIEYIYSTDEMLIDSVNNDAELSHTEVEDTLVSMGSRQYFDEEEFDVDQETCPYCGAKVMVYEYPGGVGNKEKEEILCPKCHKVICERMTNGYFRTELAD
jgi:predicted nucleic acid-binding protein